MPNEQTSVPLFTSGEVLTAANMNLSAGTGVPVFTNTTTRDAAFGGASEKVLAEGQLCYLSDSNIVQYYSGASWATVGPASTGGLVPMVPTSVAVGSGTGTASANGQVTFTTASSVSLNGVFTSSYDNYRILFGTTVASGTGTITIRLRAAGTDITGANYLTQTMQADGTNAPSAAIASLQTSWAYMSLGSNAQSTNNFTWDLFNPQDTAVTNGTSLNGNIDSGNASRIIVRNYIYQATTSADGISFIMSANNFTGTITVYGYNQ
jgi:hypothetical protein